MVGTFCTKEEQEKRRFKRLKTQVNKDRVQVICELSTQVNKGRVQVICKLITQVNKDRVQDKSVNPGQQGQGKHYNYRNQFTKLGGTN